MILDIRKNNLACDIFRRKRATTYRVVGEVRRGRCNGGTMIVFFRIVVSISPAGSFSQSLTVPIVPDVQGISMEVPEIPEVAQVPKVTEVVAAHVVPFTSKLPRHRRRLLFLRVGQQLLDSTATSATSSTTSALGGMTPEVTPSYLLFRPIGDLASRQPSRACCPHNRSSSDLLPPWPPGGLHHITIKGYPSRNSHNPTLPRPPLVSDFEFLLGPLATLVWRDPRISTVTVASTTRNAVDFTLLLMTRTVLLTLGK